MGDSPFFKFSTEHDIKYHLRYELNFYSKLKKALNYIIPKMQTLGHGVVLENLDKIDLSELVEREYKNYYWSVICHKSVTLLVRRYGRHFTCYTMSGKKVGAFTFDFEMDLLNISDDEKDMLNDELWDNPHKFFIQYLKSMFELIEDRGVYWFWNSVALPREKHIKISAIFEGADHILSYDKLFFCLEEIQTLHVCLFAETDMLEKLKEVSVGQKFGKGKTIKEVKCETLNGYFHDAGVKVVDENGKEDWHDVYSLTMWYYDEICNAVPYSFTVVNTPEMMKGVKGMDFFDTLNLITVDKEMCQSAFDKDQLLEFPYTSNPNGPKIYLKVVKILEHEAQFEFVRKD